MNLLVVESPAKAKTINKYLGNDFEVIATVGHFRDLAKKDGVKVTEDYSCLLYTSPSPRDIS